MFLNMLEYYTMLKKENISILYAGPIWADGIGGAASALQELLKFDGLPLNEAQSIFSVFVEELNNIFMYSAEKTYFRNTESEGLEASNGTFMFGAKEQKFFLQCGNVIKNESVELIKNRIEHLNALDKTELRQYYKEQMKAENTNPESRGAGLGLIEIARRASSQLEYSFAPYGDGLSFFTLFVNIGEGAVKPAPFRLEIQKTNATPYVLVDEAAKYMKMEGASYHENIIEFFKDIYNWLNNFLKSDYKKLTFDCELSYFNSSTSKLLRNMLINMDEHAEGAGVVVNWIADADNDIIIEYGEDFKEEMCNLQFNLITK